MNRDFRKFNSSPIFPFYTPCTRRIKIQRTRRSDVDLERNTFFFFYLYISAQAHRQLRSREAASIWTASPWFPPLHHPTYTSVSVQNINRWSSSPIRIFIVVLLLFLSLSFSLSFCIFSFFLSFFSLWTFWRIPLLLFSLFFSVFLLLSINTKYLVSCKLCFFLSSSSSSSFSRLFIRLCFFTIWMYASSLKRSFEICVREQDWIRDGFEYWGKLDLISFN